MHSSPLAAIIVTCIFGVGIACAVSIASLVIGSQYMTATCDTTSFIRLSTWLIVYGSLNLFGAFCALGVVLALVAEREFAMWGNVIYLVVLGCFNLAWNIVGAVALFRDSMGCQTYSYSLWAMTLAVLILQWIGFVASCCSSSRRSQ